ncbi:hypothetical protein [Agromyces bauzanensis]
MSTLDYARDVTDLARAALPVAYYDLPEYGFPPPPTEGRYILDLHIKASRLRSLAAAQQALQLAFDAASIAVIHPEAAEDGDPEMIALLLEEPDVVLNLMWAGNGSLKLSFIINPLTEGGRSRIRLIFYLGLGIMSLLTGGALPAFLIGFGLEVVLEIARSLEDHGAETSTRTIDDRELKAALIRIGWTPPEQAWHRPGEDGDEEQHVEGG